MAEIDATLARFSLTGAPAAAGAPVDWRVRGLYLLSLVAVLGALTFNAALCLVNTRYFLVNDSYVMLSEMVLVGCTLIVAADRRIGLYLFFGLFATYMVLIFALRDQFDLKAIRDVLIPFAFYFAGSRLADLRHADFLVTAAALVVVAGALFEYLALDTYLDYFNVLGYYLARGTIAPEETFGQTRGLFISGMRPEPRTILPFLGQHRVSSVFLEPVSAGNFGVVVYAWTLFRGTMRWRWSTMAAALSIVVLADARFGLFTIVLMTLFYPFVNAMARHVWFGLPFLALLVLTIYGVISGTQGGPNDFFGRLQVTAHILTQLDAATVFGSRVTDQFTADSGLAYSLTQFGLLGCIGLWGLFVFARGASAESWKFHTLAIVYFLLLLIISNSGYSIKTAALFWFLLGTANGFVPDAREARAPPGAAGRHGTVR